MTITPSAKPSNASSFTTGLATLSRQTDFHTLGVTWNGTPKATCSGTEIHIRFWIKAEVLSQAAIKLRNPSGNLVAMERAAIASEREHVGDLERWRDNIARPLIQLFEACPCKCSYDCLRNLTNMLSQSVTEVETETVRFWDGREPIQISDFTINKGAPHYINGKGTRNEPSANALRQHNQRIDDIYEKYRRNFNCGS